MTVLIVLDVERNRKTMDKFLGTVQKVKSYSEKRTKNCCHSYRIILAMLGKYRKTSKIFCFAETNQELKKLTQENPIPNR